MRRSALVAATVLLLAACKTVGPDYRGPPPQAMIKAPAAEGPFVGAAGQGISSAEPPQHWWRLYADPRLDALVLQALSANTDLRVAAANLEQAQALLAQTLSERSIATTIAGGVQYGQPSAEQYLQSQPIPPGLEYTASFSAAYQLDLFGRLRRADEASRADVEAAMAARDAARVTVAAETARAYADVCGAGLRLAAARRSLALQQQARALTLRLIGAGRGSAQDLTRAQAQVEQSRSGLPALETLQRSALYRLAVLTGRPPAEYRRDLEACAAPPRLSSSLPVGDGAALLRRRPDVRQAERQLAAATARIGVATADLYPAVSIGASVGSTGLVQDFLAPATRSFGVGPLLSWTFPNRRAARARIAAASAVAAAALARFDGVVLTALRETETALTAYAHDMQQNGALAAARAQAELARAQAERLYRAGRDSFLPVLDAERTLASADAALATSQAQLSADQIGIFLALGGGWEDGPEAEPAPAAARLGAKTGR